MRHRRGTLGNVDAAGNFRINSRERFGMTFGIARRVAGTRAGHGPWTDAIASGSGASVRRTCWPAGR